LADCSKQLVQQQKHLIGFTPERQQQKTKSVNENENKRQDTKLELRQAAVQLLISHHHNS